MDDFQRVADTLIVYKLRSAWFEIAKIYNQLAEEYDGTLSMGFVLVAIDEEEGTPVTKIAPRMGMEPNSLSRILKSMEEKKFIYRKKDKGDKRKVYICLTDHGKAMRKIALRAVFRLEKEIVKDIPVNKLNTFFQVVAHVPKAINDFQERLEHESIAD